MVMCVYVAVFLYGEASQQEHRKTLPQVRAGEYEALPEKVSILFSWNTLVIA